MKKPNFFWAAPLLAGALVLLWFGCVSMPDGRRPLFVPHTNRTGQITYTVNSGVTNALGRASDIAEKIPLPWSTVAQTAMGVAIGVLGWVAKVKSDHASLVTTMIAGVEAASNNADVKTSIQRIAQQTGMENRLNKVVRRVKSARVRMDMGEKP
jgi:hypothetical protein